MVSTRDGYFCTLRPCMVLAEFINLALSAVLRGVCVQLYTQLY
jgi:hypothetical protein